MKKTIIAAAVAASVAAPAAFADVTVYGKIHQSLNNRTGTVSATAVSTAVDATAAVNDVGNLVSRGATADIDGANVGGTNTDSNDIDDKDMAQNKSRIGFKGNEDLGNGMEAFFKLEYETGVTDNETALGNRDGYVGIKGGFGTVMAGRMAAPTKSALYGAANVQVADGNNDDDFTGMFSSKSDRVNNALAYQNKFGAATVTLAVTGNDDDNHAANKSAGISLSPAGGLTLTAAMLDSEDNGKDSHIIGAKYAMGDLVIGAVYEKAKQDGGVEDYAGVEVDTLLSSAGATTDMDAKTYGLTAAYTMGNNVISVSYANADSDFADTTNTTTGNFDIKRTSVEFQHKMSKRTSVYAAYVDYNNDISADNGETGAGDLDSLAGEVDYSNFYVGLVHTF